VPQGLKPHRFLFRLRGAEAPFFHGTFPRPLSAGHSQQFIRAEGGVPASCRRVGEGKSKAKVKCSGQECPFHERCRETIWDFPPLSNQPIARGNLAGTQGEINFQGEII